MTITGLKIMYFFLCLVVGSVITDSFSKLRECILIYLFIYLLNCLIKK